MKAISLAVVAFSTLWGVSHAAAASPTSADDAALMQAEALGDRAPDRWQGRHHYLYDDDHQPNSETVGSGDSNRSNCAQEPVRIRRSDGSTVVRRINRCR